VLKQEKKGKSIHMNKIKITPIIKLPWGNDDGIPEIFTGAPLTNIGVENTPEKVRAIVQVRITPFDNINLLTLDKTFFILDTRGKLISKFKISPPSFCCDKWTIIDFISDEDENLYLLESCKNKENITYNLIRKLKKDGTEEWYTKKEVDRKKFNYQSINTYYQDFIIRNNQIYICADDKDTFTIFELNKKTGGLKQHYLFHESHERVFMDKTGYLYYVKEIANSIRRNRYWTQYDPKKNIEIFHSGNDDMYELLGIPIAADDFGRGYGVMGLEMGCINRSNTYDWKEKLENIVIDSSNQFIYISNSILDDNSTTILIDVLGNDGIFIKKIKLNIPNDLSQKYMIKNWKLISVDEKNNFYILGVNPAYLNSKLNTFTYQKILLKYDIENNKILNIDYEPKQLFKNEFKLQGASSWRVDGKGGVYLPLLGPDSFYIMKIDFND
jgi:hypothetical protein